jgi:hypothetical protein
MWTMVEHFDGIPASQATCNRAALPQSKYFHLLTVGRGRFTVGRRRLAVMASQLSRNSTALAESYIPDLFFHGRCYTVPSTTEHV